VPGRTVPGRTDAGQVDQGGSVWGRPETPAGAGLDTALYECHGMAGKSPEACGSPRSRARTSDSRNRRCPPGVLMLLMRPEAAHRVTVFGSTRKRAATSPGVRSRSLFPSTLHPS
jgi:hypothetical protein